MVRKLLLLLLAALLVPAAALAQTHIIDPDDLISAEAEQQIADAAAQLSAVCPMDVVVMVTDDVPEDTTYDLHIIAAYADDAYDQGGYGVGEDSTGLLYLIDLNNSVQYISTCGQAIGLIGDADEEAVMDAALPFLLEGDWGGAALAAVEQAGACAKANAGDAILPAQEDADASLPQAETSPAAFLGVLPMVLLLLMTGGGPVW